MLVEILNNIEGKEKLSLALRTRLVELFSSEAKAREAHDAHYKQGQPVGSKWDRLTKQAELELKRTLPALPSEITPLKYKVIFDAHDTHP